MKLTRKQIEIIREQTKKELKGTHQSICTTLGWYTPSQANWSYLAGWTYDGNLVVTRFGEVV
jgi:hypothetical protein